MTSDRIVSPVVVIALAAAVLVLSSPASEACTNILVTKGASADGSIDDHLRLRRPVPPAARSTARRRTTTPGASYEIRTGAASCAASIPQVAAHLRRGGSDERAPARHRRDHHHRPRGAARTRTACIHYWTLMQLALQRARTAREAIEVMTSLVEEHGYRSTAESFSIADPDEVWLMEMIGTGPGGKGAVWVAHADPRRLRSRPTPTASASGSSPSTIRRTASTRTMSSPSPSSRATTTRRRGEPFSFADAYDVPTVQSRRYTATRVWCIFRRAAPSLELDPAYHRGDPTAEPYPLWIEPESKLSRRRRHGADARPLRGHAIRHDRGRRRRAVRHAQPLAADDLGGRRRRVLLGAADLDPADRLLVRLPVALVAARRRSAASTGTVSTTPTPPATCPLYAGIDRLPRVVHGRPARPSSRWDSAWWVFNFVANIANLKYSYMIEDILAVQQRARGPLPRPCSR